VQVVRVDDRRAGQPHRRADVAGAQAAAQQPVRRLAATEANAVARQQPRLLAEPLPHQPHQLLHRTLLTAQRPVAVVRNRITARSLPTVKAAVVIPTRDRAAYLDVALGSVAPQATAAGAELVVVDDGPDPRTQAVAARHGARYLHHDAPRGLNAARNTAIAATDADLLCFVDDDVEVRAGWLDALFAAADRLDDDAGVLTGPIHARIEDHRFRMCGREGPPITTLDFGPSDRADVPHAWGRT
jgi:hypothetical protein